MDAKRIEWLKLTQKDYEELTAKLGEAEAEAKESRDRHLADLTECRRVNEDLQGEYRADLLARDKEVAGLREALGGLRENITCGCCDYNHHIAQAALEPECGGEVEDAELVECEVCHGDGKVITNRNTYDTVMCNYCKGTGKTKPRAKPKCKTCGGSGEILWTSYKGNRSLILWKQGKALCPNCERSK